MSNANKSHKGLLLLPVFTLSPLLLFLSLAKQIAGLRLYGSKVDRDCLGAAQTGRIESLYIITKKKPLPWYCSRPSAIQSRRGSTTLQLPSLASSISKAW